MPRLFDIVLAALLLPLATAPAAAQGAPQSVSRRDLADAYLVIDRLAMTRGIPDASRAEWNRDFDRTTLAFFSGDFARVLREMHDLTARMAGDAAPASATRQTLGLRLRSVPRVLTPEDASVRITATVLYRDSSSAVPRDLVVRVLRPDGSAVFAGRIAVPADAAPSSEHTLTVPAPALNLREGRYRIEAAVEGAAVPLRSPLSVLPRRADHMRAELEAAVSTLGGSADAQALASFRARVALLRDVPDEMNSAQFLADPVALTAALGTELDALRAGRDPYRRTGDIWRVLAMPGGDVPLRLYVPPQARRGQPLPIVIALHGAGADENLFLEGYGAGILRALADSAGFVLLSPNTTAFARDPATLDSALALVSRVTPIDTARVFVIGHSMGGAVAVQLASAPQQRVRAAVVLAGVGTVAAARSLAPTHFVAASEDLVIPVTRVQAAYDTLRARSLPVSLEIASGWGHTLMVGAHLSEAVRWLLAR